MASPFEGLPTQTEGKEDAGSQAADVFGAQPGGFGESGTSVFSFLNSAAEAPGTSQPPGESVFSFLNSADVSEPAPITSPPQESSPLAGGSAFAFLGGGSQSSDRPEHAERLDHLEVPSPAPLSVPSAPSAPSMPSVPVATLPAAVPMVSSMHVASSAPFTESAPAETGIRKKTRKALLPGHASRPQEAGVEATRPVIPVVEETEEKPPLEAQASKPPPPPEPVSQETFHHTPHVPALDQLAESEPERPKEPQSEPPRMEQADSLPAPVPEVVEQKAGYETERPAQAEPVQQHVPQHVPTVESSYVPQKLPERPAEPSPEPKVKPKPPPPPPPTPEKQLQRAFNVSGVWQWLEGQLVNSEKEQKQLLEAEASCLSASQQTADNIAALRQKLEATEADQNSLCDKEQYEEADALDAQIQELKDLISRELEEVASGAKKLVIFAENLLGLTRDRASLSTKALERVEALQLEGKEAFKETEERCQRRVSAEEARMESERKRMDLAQSHLQKDSQNLQEEWQQVNEAIDQQTTEDVAERDKAVSQRGELDEEIQELERLLASKLEQRKELTQVIDSCDIRIACIRSKFEKQLGRLEGKQKRLEEAQKEMDMDTQQVSQMEAELQKEREALKEQEVQHQRQMKEIRKTSKELRRQRWFLAEVIQHRVVWQKLMEPHRDSLSEARSKWEETTQKCLELSATSASQEAEAAKLRSQIDGHVQMLPNLEAEKKLAVASRSFKEAGRLTEEIRRRQEGKEKFEAELEALQAGLAAAREALATCRQSEQEAQAELLKVEENCAVEELRVLRHQVTDLQELCKSPALSVNDRRLYEQEICVMQRQQEHLSKKYSVDVATLEDIPKDVIGELQDKNDMELPSESEEEELGQVPNGTSEPGLVQEKEDPAPATSTDIPEETSEGKVEDIAASDVASPAAASPAAASPAAASPAASPANAAGALSPAAVKERVGHLKTLIEELKVKIDGVEPEIEKACEVENFDLAEELETQRKDLAQQLTDFGKELEVLQKDMPSEEAIEQPEADAKPEEKEEADAADET